MLPELIKEWIEFLVENFKSYGAILINPKKFFVNHTFENPKNLRDAFLFTLLFVSLTMLVYLPTILGPKKTILISNKIDGSLYIVEVLALTLLLIVIYALAIHVSWWMVGGKALFTHILTIYSYYFGVLIFAFGLLHLSNVAILYGINQTSYEVFIDYTEIIYNEGLYQLVKKYPAEFSLYFIPHIVFGLGWGIWGWGAYRHISRINSKWKSVLALILTGVLSTPILYIYFNIQRVFYDSLQVSVQ